VVFHGFLNQTQYEHYVHRLSLYLHHNLEAHVITPKALQALTQCNPPTIPLSKQKGESPRKRAKRTGLVTFLYVNGEATVSITMMI